MLNMKDEEIADLCELGQPFLVSTMSNADNIKMLVIDIKIFVLKSLVI